MSRAPGSDRPGDSAEPLAGANPLDPPVAAAQPRTDAAPVFDEAAPRGDANAPLDARVEDYTVRSGDTLVRIARQHRVTPELLAALNGLNRRGSIRAGQTLRVVRGPFSAVIDKSRFAMDVLLDGQLVQSFPVGLGRDGRTPRGTWRVFNKLVNPSWVDPGTSKRYAADDPANPVGEHWLGLEGLSGDAVGKLGYGIHGTIDPASIGRNESLGCVRLRPADVRRVYELLVEGGSTVEIR
jgi:lipoprotein-anchoring transpeptidase ErfK/SrfK